MSESTESTEQETTERGVPVELPNDHPLVKTLAAQKEQIKELKSKASRLDELEESQKSELEKALARADAAEAKLAKRDEADAMQKLANDVAQAKGIADASVLIGSTQAELESHADKILALLPDKPGGPPADSGGQRGDDIEAEEADAKEIASNLRI